ncbi:MAG TPA: DUF3027 domain-containing protein [Thermoanaerobaculia bacterium]|nr:DUF3027 domain-containing protein [Thermoanaerobaculia bacterium]
MQKGQLSALDFEVLVHPLLGMTVSLARKSYGTTIYLELGRLRPPSTPYLCYGDGDVTIGVDWDWRVEEGDAILYGSSDTTPVIKDGIESLTGTVIESLAITGEVPELSVGFSNGQRLQSMVMTSGDPQWSIRLPNGAWLFAQDGMLVVGDGSNELSAEERATFDFAKATARRWGAPVAEPKKGTCVNCRSYVRLNGEGHLLDFGVCTDSSSPFDGRAVRGSSGCPMFRPWPA